MVCRVLKNYGAKVTSPFGMRLHPVTGIYKLHNGVDVVGEGSRTDYITAHTGGLVLYAGYSSALGWYVNVGVSETCFMQYCHMSSRPKVSTGHRVEQGDVLGYMGSTGYATGAHLHFGIHDGNEWIDPAPYLYKDYLTKEDDEMVVYKKLEDVPEWYRPSIKKLMDAGALQGTGNGEINVDESLCRMITILDRMGKLD